MAENSFQNTVEALFKGMDSFITTKTVVGDAITVGDLADKFTGKDKDDANTTDDIEHILNQEEKKQGE